MSTDVIHIMCASGKNSFRVKQLKQITRWTRLLLGYAVHRNRSLCVEMSIHVLWIERYSLWPHEMNGCASCWANWLLCYATKVHSVVDRRKLMRKFSETRSDGSFRYKTNEICTQIRTKWKVSRLLLRSRYHPTHTRTSHTDVSVNDGRVEGVGVLK